MKKLMVSKNEQNDYELIFFALSHNTRRQILTYLSKKNVPTITGEIAGFLTCSWPTMTRHLQTLQKAELVSVKKQGREYFYEINIKRFLIIEKWVNNLKR